jgi:hypothetical protein
MENEVIFYDHSEYFIAIWYNLWPLGRVCGHFVYFSRFGMFGPTKIWQPCLFPLFVSSVGGRALEFFAIASKFGGGGDEFVL